ncbi:MAG: SURF1 family protein [Limnohabitans sp.]
MTEPTRFWQRILILCVSLLAVGVTLSLGMWQVGRGAQKMALQEARNQRAAMAVLDGRTLQATDDVATLQSLMHRSMTFRGHWVPGATVYLDNRQMQGRTGFLVMTPMKLSETGVVVLVQRGWVPRSFTDRTALPAIKTPADAVEVTGHLAPWPSRLYDFGGVEDGPIRQNLDLNALRQQTGLALLDVSLIQDGAPNDGLLRDWPVPSSGVEKHQGYAFQWFGLSALIALLYVWFQIVQPRRKK